MTNLEKILIRTLINLIRDIENYEDSFYFYTLGCEAEFVERGYTKIFRIADKPIKSLCNYIDNKNNNDKVSLSKAFIDYFYDHLYIESIDNEKYIEKIIKIFETIEENNN